MTGSDSPAKEGFSGMSEVRQIPDYREIDDVLGEIKARVDAAEGHGILCGMLSTGGHITGRDWLRQVLPEEARDMEVGDALLALFNATAWQLDDPQFSFTILLPDEEDVPLGDRTRALAHWCSGFLYGLGVGGVTESTQLPGEAAEVLADLAKIASVDYELEQPGEEEEQAYEEVVEYVRVAALLVFESMRGPREDESVH